MQTTAYDIISGITLAELFSLIEALSFKTTLCINLVSLKLQNEIPLYITVVNMDTCLHAFVLISLLIIKN